MKLVEQKYNLGVNLYRRPDQLEIYRVLIFDRILTEYFDRILTKFLADFFTRIFIESFYRSFWPNLFLIEILH